MPVIRSQSYLDTDSGALRGYGIELNDQRLRTEGFPYINSDSGAVRLHSRMRDNAGRIIAREHFPYVTADGVTLWRTHGAGAGRFPLFLTTRLTCFRTLSGQGPAHRMRSRAGGVDYMPGLLHWEKTLEEQVGSNLDFTSAYYQLREPGGGFWTWPVLRCTISPPQSAMRIERLSVAYTGFFVQGFNFQTGVSNWIRLIAGGGGLNLNENLWPGVLNGTVAGGNVRAVFQYDIGGGDTRTWSSIIRFLPPQQTAPFSFNGGGWVDVTTGDSRVEGMGKAYCFINGHDDPDNPDLVGRDLLFYEPSTDCIG